MVYMVMCSCVKVNPNLTLIIILEKRKISIVFDLSIKMIIYFVA